MTQDTTRISLKNKDFRAGLNQLESFDLIGHTFHAELTFNNSILQVSAENEADQKAVEKTIHALSSYHDEVNAVDDKTLRYIVKNNIRTDEQRKRFSGYQQARSKAISLLKAEQNQQKNKKIESVTMANSPTMTKTNQNEKVVTAKTGKQVETLFSINGRALDMAKQMYNVSFESHKTKVRIKSVDGNMDKLTKAAEFINSVVYLEDKASEKHLLDLMLGEEKNPTEKREAILVQSKTKLRTEKKPAGQIQRHLVDPVSTEILFSEKNIQFVQGVQKIFNIKTKHDKGTQIFLWPKNLSSKPAEKQQNDLLLTQAGDVLTALTENIKAGIPLSTKLVSELALERTKNERNLEKTKEHVLEYYGSNTFEVSEDNTIVETNLPNPTKTIRKEISAFDITLDSIPYGDDLIASKTLTDLLSKKLGVNINHKKNTKKMEIRKNRDSRIDVVFTEKVLAFTQQKYIENESSLEPGYFENVIDNALNGLPLDYIKEEKKAELDISMRRESYRVSTYNKSGENQFMYPRTQSQYDIYDAFYGKPSRDIKKSFNELGKKVIFGIGPAASGKTSWATFLAVQAFKLNLVKKLVFCRPMVAAGGEKEAALPGGIKEKTAPYLMPLYDSLTKVMPAEEAAAFLIEASAPGAGEKTDGIITKNLRNGQSIEICKLELLRGRDFENAFILGDEMQNATKEQMRMFLTRIGKGSRAFVSVDLDQIDLQNKSQSGGPEAIVAIYEDHKRGGSKDITMIPCNGNMRDPVVGQILDAYAAFDNNGIQVTKDTRDKTIEDHYKKSLKILGKDRSLENDHTANGADIANIHPRDRALIEAINSIKDLTKQLVISNAINSGVTPKYGNA